MERLFLTTIEKNPYTMISFLTDAYKRTKLAYSIPFFIDFSHLF